MVEWFFWDSSLISTTKIVPEMTYNVLSGTLNTKHIIIKSVVIQVIISRMHLLY